ncbi:MAG: ABC transporter permease [Planctomycetes bacterium]|nr:ABC transporter permease [Planctomycetota bacterium]
MRIIRGSQVALKTLFSHKLRTVFATLGIIIGVSSVIVMVAIGEGAQTKALSKIRAMGTDLVIVTAGQVRLVGGRQRQTGNVTTLTMRDTKAISDEAQNIKAVAPVQSAKMLVKYEASNTTANIVGTTEEILGIKNLLIDSGRFFSEDDNKSLQRVAVLGKTIATEFFVGAEGRFAEAGQTRLRRENRNPVGEQIRIGNVLFEVIGILKEKGADITGADQDDIIYLPINTALRRLFNLSYINNIYVQAKDSGHIESAANEIRGILQEKHKLRGKPDDFTIQNQAEILRTEQITSQVFTNLLSAVAVIALLVGGIGILAVMLISIKERTREIGVRRAVGALRRDILLQFIMESFVLSLTGGIIGIILGVFASVGISYFTGWQLSLSVPAIIIAFLFSGIIGMVFGVYPAIKAAFLNPIKALQAE